MPLYEFRCPSCGARFEELVSRDAAEQVVCPECGQPRPVRQLSTFSRSGEAAFESFSSSSCGNRGGFS